MADPMEDALAAALEEGAGEDPEIQSILDLSTAEINSRSKMLENSIKAIKSEITTLQHQKKVQDARIRENKEKIKMHKQLPYLVAHIVEVIAY